MLTATGADCLKHAGAQVAQQNRDQGLIAPAVIAPPAR